MNNDGGISAAVKGKPDYRVLYLPIQAGEGVHNVGHGVRVIDLDSVMIGGKPFVKLMLDISKETGPALPKMPDGWDYRTDL